MIKEELRRVLKIKRKYFGEVQKAHADGCICDNFLTAFGNYNSFFIYNSLPAEADTKGIINWLSGQGKQIFLPRVEGENMVAVPFAWGGQTFKSAFGTDEPCGQATDQTPQVTVTPILGVNARGYRIGYGGGYYDRYFKDRHTVRVGIGYFFQLCEFKEEAHDMPLDYFVCERGIYRFGK